ncbi:MAG TPA: glycosyltransferase family 4 protein [Vicinamibacteria bacterium]
MRILAITAGAGAMYCGSCLRDNALAAEMMARGHDVSLLPIYTPTVTDEPNVSDDRVFFGGVSVYLQQHVPLFRRTPWVLDKIWDSTAVIRALTGRSVSVNPKMLGELTVSMLKGEHGFQAKEVEKLLHFLEGEPPYDVIVLPNTLLLGLAGPIRRRLGRPVGCTLQGEDLFLENLIEPYRSQSLALIREQVPVVDGFFAVSDYYAGFMAGYLGLPRERVHTIPLGIHLERGVADRPPRPADRPFTVGYFARIAPEKGLHLLAEAYRLLRGGDGDRAAARLEVAGYLAPEHREYLATIRRQLESGGLGAEFRYHGTLDRAAKAAFFRSVDVLSVPSPYVEPKGLYVLEAMASGLPVVQPRHGAFPEMIAKTGGGLLVEPGNPAAFAEALRRLRDDPALAGDLGRRGAEGVRRSYDAARMADRAIEVYAQLAAPARPSSLAAGARP